MPGFDVDAVSVLGEALADADGRGGTFRAEPVGEHVAIIDSVRLAHELKAQSLLDQVARSGFALQRAR